MSDQTTGAKSDAALKEFYQKKSTAQHFVAVSKKFMPCMAAPLLEQMGLTKDVTEPVSLLDTCCGAGLITQEVQSILPKGILEKSSFMAADNSEMLLDAVKERIVDEGWVNTEARLLDAQDSKLPEESFSHVAISLGVHIVPNPTAILKDVKRILKPNGILGFTTFHHDSANAFWRTDMRTAFASFPFTAPFPDDMPLTTQNTGPWDSPDWVEAQLRAQGYEDVLVKPFKGTHEIGSPEDWVFVFGGMLGWVMNAFWSEELRREHPVGEVKDLTLRHLEEKYGGKSWEVGWTLIVATAKV